MIVGKEEDRVCQRAYLNVDKTINVVAAPVTPAVVQDTVFLLHMDFIANLPISLPRDVLP